MSSLLKPTRSLSRLFSEWPRPDTIFGSDFFDIDSELFPTLVGVNVPSVNIKETPQEYSFEMAVPGLDRNDLKVEYENNNLTISAEKEENKEQGQKSDGYSRREYSYNSFSRSFALPENVNGNAIDAKYKDGILTIHVPKMRESQPKLAKQISVE